MTSSIEFQYRATSTPCALPTIAEIDASTDVLNAYGLRKVVRVGENFVVKYGQGIDSAEAENMLYVQKATSIKIPKVYAQFTEVGTRRNFIIMEYIEGETLASAWANLNDEQKSKIISKLRDSFNELRQLPSPGYFGSLGKGPLLDDMFWTPEKISSISGPFETEPALNEAMVQKYLYDGRTSYKADYYRQSLPHVYQGHPPTFSHADCQRKNIIVRISPSSEGVSNGHQPVGGELEITIIDWEHAGWYPSYWEYSLAIFAVRWDDDWGLRIQEFLAPYHAEALWAQMLRLELWS